LGKDKKKFIPTELGISVNNFLVKYFPKLMDYKFTSNMELNLDDIAEGNKIWYNILNNFYKEFHPIIEELIINRNEIRSKIKNRKNIGIYPSDRTNNYIYAEVGKYGPYLYIEENQKKIKSVKISKPLTIDNITLDKAIELLKYPIILGEYKDKEIKLFKTTNGIYIYYDDIYIYPDNKNDDSITYEQAIELIDNKFENIYFNKKANNILYTLLVGPYGPYIRVKHLKNKKKDMTYKIPNNINTKDLTIKKIKELIKN
jgi:DNA topoisomerase-1